MITEAEFLSFAREHRDYFIELCRERSDVAGAVSNGADVVGGLAMAAGRLAVLSSKPDQRTDALDAVRACVDLGAAEAIDELKRQAAAQSPS
jgi:hypothetical protein